MATKPSQELEQERRRDEALRRALAMPARRHRKQGQTPAEFRFTPSVFAVQVERPENVDLRQLVFGPEAYSFSAGETPAAVLIGRMRRSD